MAKKPIEEQNLSTLFFVLSLGMLLAILYMVYDEAFLRRPWKDYQKQWYQLQVDRLSEDLDKAKGALEAKQKDSEEYQTAAKALEELTAGGSEHARQLAQAETELDRWKADLAIESEKLNFAKADFDAMRYLVEKAKNEGDPALAELSGKLQSLTEQRDVIQAAVDKIQGSFDEAQKQVTLLLSKEKDLRAVLATYEKDVDDLRTRKEAIESRYLSILSPEGFEEHFVPKPEAIKQIINNDLGVVDRCTTCHMGIDKEGFEDAPQPFTTHSNLKEMLVENHNAIGCTPCHWGRGRALTTDKGHGFEHHWLWPMKKGERIQSNCYSCHDQGSDLAFAPALNEGHDLIQENGCFGCHPIKGYEWERVGPALNKVAAKADFDWLVNWIQHPKHYLPRTRMPFFYFDADQSRAVAAYLVHSSSETVYETVDAAAGDIQAGENLVNDLGCLGCHSLEPKDNDSGPRQGPNLTEVGKKTNPTWLYHWVKKPSEYNPKTKMPDLRLTDQEALNITAYLSSLTGTPNTTGYQVPSGEELVNLAKQGEELIKRYGCFGCHHINGFEDRGRIGTELSEWGGKDTHLLDYGHQELPHTREAWLAHKLKDPRSFDMGRILPENDKLRMPNFELNDDEIQKLVVAVTSFQKEPIPDVRRPVPEGSKYRPSESQQAIIAGRKVIEKYNCAGCHQIERHGERDFWGGDIRAYIEDPGYYPPILYGEGKKVQADWLYNFLLNVKTIRPWLKVRMPTFPFTEEEALAVVEYFNAIDEAEYPYTFMEKHQFQDREVQAGMYLMRGFQCVNCHAANQEMVDLTPDKSTLAPDLSLVKERLRFDWLHDWIINPANLAPGTRMPDNFPDMGEDKKDASLAFMMMQAPQNAELKAWFDSQYTPEELKKYLSDTQWVIARLQDQLWNFNAESYLAKFPWTPPAPVEEEEYEEGEEYEEEEYYEEEEEGAEDGEAAEETEAAEPEAAEAEASQATPEEATAETPADATPNQP